MTVDELLLERLTQAQADRRARAFEQVWEAHVHDCSCCQPAGKSENDGC